MTPRFPSVAPSLRAWLFAALIVAPACAHGLEQPTVEDAGPRAGSAGMQETGGGDVAGSNSDGGSGGSSGGSDPSGGGGMGDGGSDLLADSGSDVSIDMPMDAAVDAADAGDALADSAPLDSSVIKRPTGITMSATSVATARQTPSTGGSPYNDECPANQVLVGFKGTVDTVPDGGAGNTNLRSVQGVCAPLTVTATQPYRVNVGATNLLPVRQTPSTVAQTVNCPMNQVIVGFQGRTAMYIEAIQLRCAPLVISGTSPNFTVAPGNIMVSGPLGAATAGAMFSPIDCPAGQVAVAQAPRAGSAIDSFGMVCRTPTLVLQ
jgi:hypothetical protein